MSDYETHAFDVVVVGAGGAGLRAAIEAARQGARTAVVCKSLLGKAHTVMAEGGIAAALGNVYPEDNWQVHFRDTMRGGKLLNNWRMAQIHAQEAPERVLELEEWGALFDRTPDGRILQRDFGGHRYARLAHVGDRTGLEMIRTLQHRADPGQIDVFMECTVTRLLKDGDRIAGAFAYWRETGRFVVFEAPAVVLATGGIGKAYKVTSNSWEYTGDGHALALWAGAELIDMEFVQFHPTGMVWPPSVRGILVTEGVRGDGGVLRNSTASGSCSTTSRRCSAPRPPTPRRRPTAGTTTRRSGARPTCCPATRSRGRSTPRSRRAAAARTAASTSTSPRRRDADVHHARLPGMYHQFRELADVDITKEPMEVGPTCHYMMGGVRVDAETQASTVPGLFAAGEVAAGLHGANRLGGNSLSDLLVFGRRAGLHAAEYAAGVAARADRRRRRGRGARRAARCARSTPTARENPYTIQQDLQECMQNLVGIIRTEDELAKALDELGRAARAGGPGARRGPPAVQPRLAPRARPRPAARRVRVHHPGGTRAHGEPRRADPGGLSRAPTPSWPRSTSSSASATASCRSTREPLPAIPTELDALVEGGLMAQPP